MRQVLVYADSLWHAAQGIAALIGAIRTAPIEPGMPVPPVLIVAPPPLGALRGPIAPKFAGGEARGTGLAAAYREVAEERGLGVPCAYAPREANRRGSPGKPRS